MTQVTEPFPIFYDDDGTPLENGMIYIGVSGLNPRTNPVAVFFDEALTVPASQPIRTLGGRPAYQGAPARLFIAEAAYSIEVQNAFGSPVTGPTEGVVITAADISFTASGTGAVARTVQAKLRETISVKDFGAVGDGVTNDTAAIALAFTAGIGKVVHVPAGNYLCADVLVPGNVWVQGDGANATKFTRAGALTNGIFNYSAGAADISVSDVCFDGLSAADAASLVRLNSHGSNVEFSRVRFQNGCDRWVLRGDPVGQFSRFIVKDCEFINNPIGNVIILAASAAVAGSSQIEYIGNYSNQCGGNLFGARPFGAVIPDNGDEDFFFDCRFSFNTITDCTNTGANGPIPVEMWGISGFELRGNLLDSGTRGLTAGAGCKDVLIADNIIKNQTLYAMEGGAGRRITIENNIAVNCASFYKDTTPAGAVLEDITIQDNFISGSGLASYDNINPRDTIFFGADNTNQANRIIIRNNTFVNVEYVRTLIRLTGSSSPDFFVKGNIAYAETAQSAITFVSYGVPGQLISQDNLYIRTAELTSAHYGQSFSLNTVFNYVGSTSSSDGTEVLSESDSAEMRGTLTSGTIYAIGRLESATARYGMAVDSFNLKGNWSSGPLRFADSSGSVRLDKIDFTKANLTTANAIAGINSSLLVGTQDGQFLMRAGQYYNLRGGVQRLKYRGSASARTIKLRFNLTSGGQSQAVFRVNYVATNNNSTPQSNEIYVAWGNVSSAAAAPFIYQGGGTVTTTATALDGSGRMEVTITLPAANNNWLADIEASADALALIDFSARVD